MMRRKYHKGAVDSEPEENMFLASTEKTKRIDSALPSRRTRGGLDFWNFHSATLTAKAGFCLFLALMISLVAMIPFFYTRVTQTHNSRSNIQSQGGIIIPPMTHYGHFPNKSLTMQLSQNAMRVSRLHNKTKNSEKSTINGRNFKVPLPENQVDEQLQHPAATIPRFHLVFSTGCSIMQDWQSYIFFYHVWQSGQKGDVTRIASGCTVNQGQELQQMFDRQVQHFLDKQHFSSSSVMDKTDIHFHLHLTPDFSKSVLKGVSYKYFNKPFGMKHWMEHSLGYRKTHDGSSIINKVEENTNDDTIVILLDPDQLVLKPFTNNYTDVEHMGWVHGTDQELDSVVQKGTSIAQHYGFGGQWRTKINLTRLLSDDDPIGSNNFVSTSESSSSSPLWSIKSRQGEWYAAGPPYLATAQDMYQIVDQWTEFVPRVHAQYPHLLAEMFAYSLAAVHVNLPPHTVTGLMISDTNGGGGEGWSWIDEDSPDDSEEDDDEEEEEASKEEEPNEEEQLGQEEEENVTTTTNNSSAGFLCIDHYQRQPRERMPYVLHYCQKYHLGKWFFSKYKLPKNFLSCESPLLREPTTEDNLLDFDYALRPDGRYVHLPKVKHRLRNAWVLCTVIPALNQASSYYKQQFCAVEDGLAANYTKTLVFHSNFTM